jgi:hypothetical protein
MRYVHYIAGGGLGDVVREALYNGALGILKRWKLRHPEDYLKVCTMSHNPSHVDLFYGQHWIDELKPCRFPLELGWKPEMFYEWHPDELREFTELRFVLNEKKSLYRVDLQAQRSRPIPVVTIPPISVAADIALTLHERQIVEHHSGAIVVHPFGGESHKWFPTPLLQAIQEAAGKDVVVVGASYDRPGHEDEIAAADSIGIKLRAFQPRVLLEIVRRAKAVVGSESSVYYMAAMWGIPVAMLWARSGTYDLVKQKKSNWDWYFGEAEGSNLVVPLPPLMTGDECARLLEWIQQRANRS